MNNRLEIHLFGGLQIRYNQQVVTDLVSRKAEALLAYLACQQRPYPRDVLADIFWENRTQTQAAGNLRVVLNSLRNTVNPFVTIERHTVAVNRQSDLWVDALAFEQLLGNFAQTMSGQIELPPPIVDQMEKALALYQGEFLTGFFIRQAPQFDEWARIERERLHILAVKTVQLLSLHYLATQQYGLGVNTVERWLHFDLLNEEAHRTLMLLLAREGHRSAALQHYERIVALFQDELGNPPSAETEALYYQILDDAISPVVRSVPALPLTTVTGIPHNLAAPLSPIVGREDDLVRILSHLQNPACRLLTLVGIGGTGKTRLALEAALRISTTAAAQPLFADGIFWVSLEHVETDSLLLSAMAQAVQYVFQGVVEPVKQLLEFLRHRRLLLVLDNVEQLTSQSALILQLLQAAPGLKLLVTSRERLNFQGEWLVEVGGLPFPTLAERDAWDQYPATQLFMQCATAMVANFTPQPQLDAIVQICRLMEGLPLGIQLAAASTRIFTCQQILVAIQRNLDFLSSTMRNLPLRHRSLRAIFDHSWLLLTPVERSAFQRLAIFEGSFTAHAAATVAEITTAVLTDLLDKSLIQVMGVETVSTMATSERRYRMHPIVHQYAAEKLAEANHDLAQRHALYYGRFVAEQAPLLHTAEAAGAIDLIFLEIENIRKSWQSAATLRLTMVLRLYLPGLIQYYRLRGLLGEGQALLSAAIEIITSGASPVISPATPSVAPSTTAAADPSLLYHLLAYKAALLNDAGRYDEAIATVLVAGDLAQGNQDQLALDPVGEALNYLQWGIALHRQADYGSSDQKLAHALQLAKVANTLHIQADAHLFMGRNRLYLGDYAGGQTCHEQAITLYRINRDLVNELAAYNSLAMLYLFTGEYAKARTSYERCLRDYRMIGNRPAIGLILNNLGAVATLVGKYVEAQRYYEESLTLRRLVGGYQPEALILANLALIRHQTNANQQALEYCHQALQLSIELGERDTESYARLCLGHGLAALGHLDEAAASYGLALIARRRAGQHTQALEPLSGLARVALAQNNLAQAKAYVDEIVPQLGFQTYAGIVELIRIYLTCYQVLAAVQDPQADKVLAMGYAILQERAAKIDDVELRCSYLQIAVHAEVRRIYEEK